jgi:ADP-ribose pyrophosphatase
MDRKPLQKLKGEVVFSSDYFHMVSDAVVSDAGHIYTYSYLEARDGVAVVALDKEQQVYLIKEYKYPVGKWITTLPAGGIDAGMTPLTAAKTELEQEVGIRANKWARLPSFYPAPATMTFAEHIYLAQDLEITKQKLEETEYIKPFTVSLTQAVEMALTGKIEDSWGALGILVAEFYLEQSNNFLL